MSALWQFLNRQDWLKRPHLWLLILLLLVLLVAKDVMTSPAEQVIGNMYAKGINNIYKPYISPLYRGKIECRYNPSCSTYSMEAVKFFGIIKGLSLTYKRITSCTAEVPLGTKDSIQK